MFYGMKFPVFLVMSHLPWTNILECKITYNLTPLTLSHPVSPLTIVFGVRDPKGQITKLFLLLKKDLNDGDKI